MRSGEGISSERLFIVTSADSDPVVIPPPPVLVDFFFFFFAAVTANAAAAAAATVAAVFLTDLCALPAADVADVIPLADSREYVRGHRL